MQFKDIKPISKDLLKDIQYKLDNKAKPVGSLGYMEDIATQIALIQNSLNPILKNPTILTVASDHDIIEEGVASAPADVTWQQVLNFLNYGGAIGLFCKVNNIRLRVVDAGVNHDFAPHPRLINAKIRKGTRNFHNEPAMTTQECNSAISNGMDIIDGLHASGTNIVGFGEMGIGNTTPATAILSVITGKPVSECVGPGAGIPPKGVIHKQMVIEEAIKLHGRVTDPLEILRLYGGLEIATIVGGMHNAARLGLIILVDGFITTAAAIIACAIDKNISDYMIFCHTSKEGGHKIMLDHIGVKPILDLNLRLGEGTGAAIAYPIVNASVELITNMTSFEETGVINTSELTRMD